MNSLYILPPETRLPWSSSKHADDRFYEIALLLLLLALAIGVAIPMISVPEKTREERKKLPPQLAKVVIEEQRLEQAKPPEPIEQKKEKPKDTKPEKKPEPKEPAKDPVKRAQQQAEQSGLLQFQDDLAAMRDAFDLSSIDSSSSLAGESTAANLDRSVISQKSRRSSGGVNVAALSRDTGGVALSAIETSEVETEFAKAATDVAKEKAGAKKRTVAVRNEEDVRKIMEANKGAIFAIYNRALRSDPSLQGKFTVKMVIDRNGILTDLSVVFSELNNDDIENKLLNRIRLISFGSSDVATTTLNYTFDFLPR